VKEMTSVDPTIWLAFAAGLLSFISPCCLPLYPSYISYITGISVSELNNTEKKIRKKAIVHTLFFMLGFSIIFITLGLSATFVGSFFKSYQGLIRQLGGILIIVMGLFMMGLFQNSLLMREKRWEMGKKPRGYLGSTLVGVSFAAGWTPCIGPILASVLVLSASEPTQGVWFILAYTLGFSIPFFIMSFFLAKIKWIQKYAIPFMRFGGAMMVIAGILLYTNKMTDITIWLIRLYGGFTGF
jgi:cytochrome c-type biogenesis protein